MSRTHRTRSDLEILHQLGELRCEIAKIGLKLDALIAGSSGDMTAAEENAVLDVLKAEIERFKALDAEN